DRRVAGARPVVEADEPARAAVLAAEAGAAGARTRRGLRRAWRGGEGRGGRRAPGRHGERRRADELRGEWRDRSRAELIVPCDRGQFLVRTLHLVAEEVSCNRTGSTDGGRW